MKRKPLKTIRWKVVREDPKGKRISCLAKKEFSLAYTKGKRVEATPHSMGIMCFDTRRNAERFFLLLQYKMATSDPTTEDRRLMETDFVPMIVKVRPIGRGWKPRYINSIFGATDIRHVCDRIKRHGLIKTITEMLYDDPPKGTICYHEVEVLS